MSYSNSKIQCKHLTRDRSFSRAKFTNQLLSVWLQCYKFTEIKSYTIAKSEEEEEEEEEEEVQEAI